MEDRQPERQPGGAEDVALLTADRIQAELARLPAWRLSRDGTRITRHLCFADYQETIEFVLKAARVAHTQGHYPIMHVERTCLELDLTTPELDGVSENDVALATHLDALYFVHLATANQEEVSHYPPSGGCGGGCGSEGGCG